MSKTEKSDFNSIRGLFVWNNLLKIGEKADFFDIKNCKY